MLRWRLAWFITLCIAFCATECTASVDISGISGFHSIDVSTPVEGKRVALVIGNARYKHTPELANTTRDAQAVAGMLRKFGFDATLVLDVTKAGLLSALRQFGRRFGGPNSRSYSTLVQGWLWTRQATSYPWTFQQL